MSSSSSSPSGSTSSALTASVGQLWTGYLRLLEEKPFLTKVVTSGAIQYFSDFVAQAVFEKTGVKGVDHVRICKFVAYSVAVTPLYDHWYQFLDSLPITQFVSFLLRTSFPAKRKSEVQKKKDGEEGKEKEPLSTVLIKLGLDQLVLDPVMTLFFYVFMGVLDRKSWREMREDMRKTYWLTQTSAWKMWPLVNFIMFRYVPEHMQILFGNVVSFIWNIYRSLIVMG